MAFTKTVHLILFQMIWFNVSKIWKIRKSRENVKSKQEQDFFECPLKTTFSNSYLCFTSINKWRGFLFSFFRHISKRCGFTSQRITRPQTRCLWCHEWCSHLHWFQYIRSSQTPPRFKNSFVPFVGTFIVKSFGTRFQAMPKCWMAVLRFGLVLQFRRIESITPT